MSYYDLHVHTFFSDGALGPAEVARRAEEIGLAGLVFCDHVDPSTLARTVEPLAGEIDRLNEKRELELKVGCELTHVTPQLIPELAEQARRLGAGLVAVHGESPVEPVAVGTNQAAVNCPQVDFVAHPGFITGEELETAAVNDVALELTARGGHSLTNGYLVQQAKGTEAGLVVNTDAHEPDDIIGADQVEQVVRGAGHPRPEAVLENNSNLFEEAA